MYTGYKKSRFSTYILLCLANSIATVAICCIVWQTKELRYGHSCNGRGIGTLRDLGLLNGGVGAISNDLE